MRLLFVAALIAAAFAARDSHRWNKEVRSESIERVGSFKTGFEYRFNLEAQVSNGLSVPGSQQAAVRSSSVVLLSFPESETVAHLRLEKIRLGSLQKEVDEPKNLQPFELFDEIEILEENARQLRLPVRFRYENGIVSEIEFDREDAEWSKNIKRVYLNMLQVNIAQQNVVNKEKFFPEKESVFTAPEMTLEGDCEVTYTVLPENSEEKSELRVTKSINFEKCTRRAFHNVLPMEERKSIRGEEKEIQSSSTFNYLVLGSESRFLIKEVELRSVYVYSPFSEDNTLFTTFASGKMTLLDVSKEDKRIPAPKSEKTETLLHSTEWEKKMQQFFATGEERFLEDFPYPEMKNKHEVVVRMIKSLVPLMESEENGMDLSATHEMGRIVVVLRLSTKEQIKKMWRELSDSDEMTQTLFMDALALTGTYNTIEFLVEKIRTEKVSPIRASVLLKQLSSMPVPSKKIIHSLISLCKESNENPLGRQSCWLTVGALMNRVCGDKMDFILEERVCPKDLKEEFVRELVEQFERAETRYEKVLALKTIGNSGMDMIVFPLEKIIRGHKEEKLVRVHAIESLRKLGSVLPRKMISILMPVYKNTGEKSEIRVAAFRQIMSVKPLEKVVVEMIVDQLRTEKSNQVFSFVYETLSQLSDSSLPQEKVTADHIKTALKTIRPRPSRLISSNYKYVSAFNEDVNVGAAINWATLFGEDSVLPKDMKATLKTSIIGKLNKHQIGFSQHNIEKKLYKLLEKVNFENVLRGKRSTYEPSELLRELFSGLSISRREESDNDANMYVYMRVDDMDYALLPIEEPVLRQVLNNGKLDISAIKSFLSKGLRYNTVHSTMVYEHKHVLVHSLGMPLIYSNQLPMIMKVDAEIKAEIDTTGKSVDGLRLRVIARPTIAATHVTKVEIMNPLVNYGVRLLHSMQSNLPIDMTTEMEWKNEKYNLKTVLALPKESRRIAQLSSRPITFVRVWPKETRVYIQPKERTIYVPQLESFVHRLEHSLFEKATGIKINVGGHYHGHIFSAEQDMPHALLIGENNVEINFEKTEETPKEYVLRTEIGLFDKQSRMTGPKTEKYMDEEYESMEKDEDYEGRRDELKRYTKDYNSEMGYSHRLFWEIKSVGGRKEHKAEVEVKSECDEKMRHCKVALKGMTTPLLQKETRDWTFESDIEMLYPAMPETMKKLLAQKHREVSIIVDSRFGSERKNQMRFKIQGEQNKEQKMWMKKMSETRDEEMTPMEEYYRLVEASMLNKYTLIAKYDMHSEYEVLFNRLFDLIKSESPLFSTSFSTGHDEKNVVRAHLTFEPLNGQYANFSINTPSEKFTVRNIRVPSVLPRLNIRRQSVSPIRSLTHIGSAIVDETRPECTVESRKVRSFDDVIFRAPLTTCYSVLAKDCSSEQPAFAVMMKKMSKNGEEKKLKIVTKETVIELEMDKREENVRVFVDGKMEKRVERLEKLGIYKKGEIVIVELEDLTVEFDGFTANVKISEYYKNKQCGLCGHFDGDKMNEFRRADNEETEDLEEFHRSYLVVKGEECEMEDEKLSEKKNYRVESGEFEEEEEFETKWDKKTKKINKDFDSEIEPVQKTRVVEYSNRVCFSLKPLPECPKKSTEEEKNMRETEVTFTCLPRNDRETARLIREARREILDIESFSESYTETVFVPRTCVVY